jgi:hypothetical protein
LGRLYSWQFTTPHYDYKYRILTPDLDEWARCQETDGYQAEYYSQLGPGNTLLYSTSKGQIVARDDECNTLWRFDTAPVYGLTGTIKIQHPFAVDVDGTIYAGGWNGHLFAIDLQGNLLWQTEENLAVGILKEVVIGDPDLLFALNDRGLLFIYDKKGNLLEQHQLYYPYLPDQMEWTASGDLLLLHNGHLLAYTADDSLVYHWPPPVPLPQTRQEAEEELAAFVLHGIVGNVQDTDDFLETYEVDEEFPWWAGATEINLIVWAPPKPEEELEKGGIDLLNLSAPIKVWEYARDQLVERQDKLEAIAAFEEYGPCAKFACNFYDFGVLYLAEDLQQATVYEELYCGALCGWGYYFYLQRSLNGEWWVYRSYRSWVS